MEARVRMPAEEDLRSLLRKRLGDGPAGALAVREDAASVVRRQGDQLDDSSVLHWLRQFEQALDDSTLVMEYERLRAGKKHSWR